MLPPAIALLIMPYASVRRVLRLWEATIAAYWLSFGAWLLENFGGVKLIMSGDTFTKKDNVLIICNHRTRLDWMWLWSWAAYFDVLSSYRVILKDSLRCFPWWGWGMSLCLFPFIRRGKKHRSTDLAHLKRNCRYLIQLKVPNSLIIFPEGTDLSPSNQERDRNYALSRNLSAYRYVLHPRTGAFLTCLEILRPHVDAVIDLTMGYVDYEPGERPSEISLLLGRLPREIHVNLKRWDLVLTPLLCRDNIEDAKKFLQLSFDRKEALLTSFYNHGKLRFDLDAVGSTSSRSSSETSPDPISQLNAPRSDYGDDDALANERSQRRYQRLLRKGLVVAVAAVTLVVMIAYVLPTFFFGGYIVATCLLCILVTVSCEGFDSLELNLPVRGGDIRVRRLHKEH